MEFLMSAFERIINQYGYKFTLIHNKDGSYSLDMYDLPPELDYAMICLQLDKTTEVVEPIKNVSGRKGETHTILKINKINICTPKRSGAAGNIVHVDFNKDDYAAKINKIEVCLRSYFEKKNSTGFY